MSSIPDRIAEILKRREDAARRPNPAPVGRRIVSQKQVRIELGLDVTDRSQESSEESADENTTQSMNGSKDRLQLIKERRALTRRIGLSMGGDYNQFTMAAPPFDPKIQLETSCSEDSESSQHHQDTFTVERNTFTVERDASSVERDTSTEEQGTFIVGRKSETDQNDPLSTRSDQSCEDVEYNFSHQVQPIRPPLHTELGFSSVHRFGRRKSNEEKLDTFTMEHDHEDEQGTFSIKQHHETVEPITPQNHDAVEPITPQKESTISPLRSGFRPPSVHQSRRSESSQDDGDTFLVDRDTETSQNNRMLTPVLSPQSNVDCATVEVITDTTPQQQSVNSSLLRSGFRTPRVRRFARRGSDQNFQDVSCITPKRAPVSLAPLRNGLSSPAVHSFEQIENSQDNRDMSLVENELELGQNDQIFTPALSSRSDQNFDGIEPITPQVSQVNHSPLHADFMPPSVHRFGRRVVDNSVFSAVNVSPGPQIKRRRNIPSDTDTESSMFEEITADGVKEMVLKQKTLVHPATPPVGLRRSQRVRLPRLRYWAGEEPLYNQTPNGGRRLVGTTRVIVRDPRLVKAKTTDFLKLIRREHKRK